MDEWIAGEDGLGLLYEAVRVDGLPGSDSGVVAFAETPSGDVLWLRRPQHGKPQTVADLEHERRERRALREQAAVEQARKIAKMPRSALTWAELNGFHDAPTLRRACELVERSAGEVTARDGESIITLPKRSLQRVCSAPRGFSSPARTRCWRHSPKGRRSRC